MGMDIPDIEPRRLQPARVLQNPASRDKWTAFLVVVLGGSDVSRMQKRTAQRRDVTSTDVDEGASMFELCQSVRVERCALKSMLSRSFDALDGRRVLRIGAMAIVCDGGAISLWKGEKTCGPKMTTSQIRTASCRIHTVILLGTHS